MIVLQGSRLARMFGSEVLFENVQLEIQERSRVALVGRNGAGKSTLLKILAGVEEADKGAVSKGKQVTIGYLEQHTGLESERQVFEELLTVFESVRQMEARLRDTEQKISQTVEAEEEHARWLKEYDVLQQEFFEVGGYGYEAKIRSVLHGFSFDESFYSRKVSALSGGQKTRLALAKLLLNEPDLLILDEPTNHLDIETTTWLEKYLSTYSGALLIVSHDRYFLDQVTNETYELSRKKLQKYHGNYSKYLELKAAQLASEWKEYEKQQGEIHQLEDFVNRNLARASTTKRAQSRRKKLEKMERLEQPKGDESSAHFLFRVKKPSGNVVLQLEDASIGYEAAACLSKGILLDLRRQEAIALVGPNGIGKSTLLKSIVGKISFIKGEAKLGANVSIGYYDQQQAELSGKKTVLSELWDEFPETPETEIRRMLGGFLFTGEEVEKTIPLLSGGEKARVALAKLSMSQNNFLILDEPTNHLDIDSKEVLEAALLEYEGTILFVSHDRYFINRVATQVLELSESGVQLYLGDYDYYLEKKEGQAESVQKEESIRLVDSSGTKNEFQQNKELQKLRRSLTRKAKACEEELDMLDRKISEISGEMEKPEFAGDHEKLAQFHEELQQLEAQQEEVLKEWEVVSFELEELGE